MRVLIEVTDEDADFAIKVLRSLSFVKKMKLLSHAQLRVWEDLNKASEEVKNHKKGTLQLKTAQDLLNEL